MNATYSELFIFLLLIYVCGLTAEKTMLRGRYYGASPLTWFAPMWLVATILLALPIYDFRFLFSNSGFYFVILIHLAFTVGSTVGLAITLRSRDHGATNVVDIVSPRTTSLFLILGILGVMIYTADAFLSSEMSLEARLSFESMSMIKSEYADPNRIGALGGRITSIGYFLYGFGQIGIVAYRFSFVQGRHLERIAKPLCFAFLGLVAFNSIFITGGRIELVLNLLIYLLASMTLDPRKRAGRVSWNHFFYRVRYAVVAAAILWFGVIILSSRIGGGQNSIFMLYLVHSAYISDALSEVASGSPMFATMLLQLSYLAAPIPFLGVVVDYYSYGDPQIYYGGLNFIPFLSVANRFWSFLDPSFLSEASLARTAILENSGLFGNVWATAGRELLIDFGINGSLAFFFLLGVAANMVRISLWHRRTVDLATLYVLIRLQLLWSIAHGMFHHRVFGYAFILAVMLAVLAAFVRLNRKPKRFRD